MTTWQEALSSTWASFLRQSSLDINPKASWIENGKHIVDMIGKNVTNVDEPIVMIVWTSLVVMLLVFVLGLVTDKYSWVDKLWSILPVYYCWILGVSELRHGPIMTLGGGTCAGAGTGSSAAGSSTNTGDTSICDGNQTITTGFPRVVIIACIATVWGIRLSYNFWRKDGYTWSGEDYRWPWVKQHMIPNPILYQVFNLMFIAIYQIALLTIMLSPIYVCWYQTVAKQTPAQFTVYDLLGIVLTVFCLIIESVADQEQWDFHERKHSKRLTAKEKKQGFLSDGLWAWSRHPNFFAEQSFWLSMCVFARAAVGQWVGWWVLGPVMLILLFQGSTTLTEHISASKYPEYHGYQQRTSRLIPMPPCKA